MSLRQGLQQQEEALTNNRDFIVKYLDPDDVIDELIQDHLIGENAAQKVTQPMGWSREEKNRIIVDQLIMSRPGAVEKFCEIIRRKKRQIFIAEELEKCESFTTECNKEVSAPTCPIDISRLKVRYLNQLPTCKTDWPRHKVYHYVKLALVEKEDVTPRDKHLNEITKLTLKGEVDKILKKKQPLSYLQDIFYYENKPCPRLILIMGGPGIGKTTLANQICLQWAKDGFLAEEFDAIVMIPLRLVQENSLEDVMMEYVGEEDYPKLKKSAGRRCLLILEGLDEMAANRRQSDLILKRLIEKNTLLEKAKILITSRPHACERLVVDRRVEVVGFGDKEIREFVENSFPNDVELIKEFMRQLTEYPQLHSLCYVPLNLVMITDIFRFSQKKLPSTLTELYRLFIVMILQREVRKGIVKKLTAAHNVEEILYKILAGIPKEAVGIVHVLCKLAYNAFFKPCDERDMQFDLSVGKFWFYPKIIFTESDLVESGIEISSDFDGFGLLKVTHTHQLPRDSAIYNFLHLTIQEFLCSLYISTLPREEQLTLLREHFREYSNVMVLLCGLTGLASNQMFKFVWSELLTNKPLLQNDVITAVRCVYESNKSDLSHLPSSFTLQISMTALLPYDCLCLSWLLSCYPISQLKMFSCHIEDTGAKLLVKHYPSNNTTGQLLDILDLMDNNLTLTGLRSVVKILRASGTILRVINVGVNEIGDDGITMISEELPHNNQLTELSVFQCGFSVKGAIAVSTLLRGNYTLQVLDIHNNNVGDDGISVIVEQLQNISTLTKLHISKCGLSVKGATIVRKLLINNSMIRELKMGNNPVGDDGIAAIATSLTNSRISTLWVNKCNFTLSGARSLATLLSVSQTIENLDFSDNPITTEGARLILQSITNNKACIVDNIQIDDEYSMDSEVQKMLKQIKQVTTCGKTGNVVVSTSSWPMMKLEYTELTD